MHGERNVARKLCNITLCSFILKDELRLLIDSEGKFGIIEKEVKRKYI